MRKMIFILFSAILLSGCSPYGMQGNPAAVQAGAAIGGVLGAIVGDRAGGYNGSQFGALIGTVAGAAIGNAATTPREDSYQVDEYYIKSRPSAPRYKNSSRYRGDSRYEDDFRYEGQPHDENTPFASGLRIINLRFIDDNRNHMIDAEEDSKLVFDIVNDGDVPAYNVTPIIEEVSGMKHLLVSSSAQIAYMPVGNQIRYTATIRGGRKLKAGEAQFRVYATESNGAMTEMHEFSLPTQKRVKKK